MKSKIIIFFIFFSIFFNYSYAELTSCKYSDKINKCLNNQLNFRSITDFVCIQSSIGNIVFQIVLDENFKKTDRKIENYLLSLEQGKGYYFGPNRQMSFVDGVDNIEYFLGEGGEFEKEYKSICDNIVIKESMECLGGKASIPISYNFLRNNNGINLCYLTYKTSLENYRLAAYAILKENKKDIMVNEYRKFKKEQRGKFDELYNLIMINLGYLERLGYKWRTKTKNTVN